MSITATVEVEVDIDVQEALDQISTADLRNELAEREGGLTDDVMHMAMTDVYYALRDRDLDKATALINPVLDQIIGRQV